ncbi:MAG: PAC2 family protein [Nocardioidaceae bacterium]
MDDLQVNRPHVGPDAHGDRIITWPTTRFYVARPASADRDILLVRGIEPNMRWRQFVEELIGVADLTGVQMVVTLGALLADTPYTRPSPGVRHDVRPVALHEPAAWRSPPMKGRPGSTGSSPTPA